MATSHPHHHHHHSTPIISHLTHHHHHHQTANPTKPMTQSSSKPSSSNLTKRKNHLRSKILKTLKKPYQNPDPVPFHQLPNNPIIPLDPIEPFVELPKPAFGNDSLDIGFDGVGETVSVAEELGFREVVRVDESSSLVNGKSSGLRVGNVVKCGLCLVGIFVFHSIFVVLRGSFKSNDKDRVSGDEDRGNGVLEVGLRDGEVGLERSGFGYVEEGMQEKIDEIRRMARKARAKEGMRKRNGEIRKMVREGGAKGGMKIEDEEEEENLSDGDDDGGGDRGNVIRSGIFKEVDEMLSRSSKSMIFNRERSHSSDVDSGMKFGERVKKDVLDANKEEKMLMFKKKHIPKGFDGAANGSVTQAQESKNLMTEGLQDKKQELQDSRRSPKGFGMSQKNGKSNLSQTRSKSLIGGDEDRSSNGRPDVWWLNLPYALAIRMREGHDNGAKGCYILRGKSESPNQNQTTYTVAFEDLVDARNFSYILVSAFAELEDASIEIVPFSPKDLIKLAESKNMSIFVVRKGQLQLYNGQPLLDVEARLHELVTTSS